MRYTFVFCCFLALAFAGRGEVRWLSNSHSFGAFSEDRGVVTTVFHAVNDGPGEASIVSARANCGCTTPRYERRTLAPGDTAALEVGFNPSGRVGKFNKLVQVETAGADGAVTKTRLTIHGTVIGNANTIAGRYPVDTGRGLRLSVAAAAVGRVRKGRMATYSLQAYNSTADTLRVEAASDVPWLTVTATPPAIPPAMTATIYLSLHTDRMDRWGLGTDTVTIQGMPYAVVSTVDEDFSRLTPGQRAKAPAAAVETQSVDFGVVDSQGAGPLTRTLTVRNDGGGDPLLVRRLYSADPGISVSVDRQRVRRGRQAVITVTVDPRLLRGDMLNGRVQLISNDPDHPVQNIRVVGELKKP